MSKSINNRMYGYVEVIPTMCGDSFGTVTDSDGVTTPDFGTRKQIMDEIADMSDFYNEQIKRGEREPDDTWDSYPQFCFIDGDYIRYCDTTSKEVINSINWRKTL